MVERRPEDERILILAPFGRDAALACQILQRADLSCQVCADGEALQRNLKEGVGALLLTQEALVPAISAIVLDALQNQAPWSDLPLVILSGIITSDKQNRRIVQELITHGNVTMLERPLRISTLVTVMQSALRARRRQYEIAEHLVAREQRSAELDAVIHSLPDAVFAGTEDGITLANTPALRMFGFETLTEATRSITELTKLLHLRYADTGEPVPPEETVFAQALRGEPSALEVLIRQPNDGAERVIRSSAAPVRVKGEIAGAVVINADITEQKQFEKRLQESTRRLETILESITDAFMAVDRDWCLTYVNRTAESALNRTRQELLGQNLWEAFPEVVDSGFGRTYREAMEEQRVIQYEDYYPPLEGWFSVHVYPSRDGLALYFHNVTERRRTEDALRESEQRLRLMVEHVREYAIFILNLDGEIATWNSGAARIFGYEEAEIIGQTGAVLFTPEDRARGIPEQEIETATTMGQAMDDRWQLRQDGSRFWASGVLTALRDSEDNLRGFAKLLRDNTERKRAESALRQAHEQLESRVRERTAELVYTNATLIEQIEERERAEEKIRQRNRELATLNRITAAVSSSLELPAVFSTLKQLMVEQLDIPGGGLLLYNDSQDTLELKSSWGLPDILVDSFRSVPVASSPLEPVIRQKRSVLVPDFRTVKLFTALDLAGSRPDWQSFLCVPVLAKGEVQGAFGLFSNVPYAFNEAQLAFFETLGQQVGVAVQNARLFEELLHKREQLRLLAQRVVSVQEEERRRVSRELHDEAGQSLTALMISLDLLKASLPGGLETARHSISEAVNLTAETIDSIRMLAHDLRTPALDTLGLNPTLDGLCQDFGNRTHLTISYSGVDLPPLPDPVAISLYRVAQEALTNVAKHAKAEHVWVTLRYDDDVITLSIVDDGQGFNVARTMTQQGRTTGIGLPGMRERLESLGGRLEIITLPDEGTRVVARVPRREAEGGTPLS